MRVPDARAVIQTLPIYDRNFIWIPKELSINLICNFTHNRKKNLSTNGIVRLSGIKNPNKSALFQAAADYWSD